jgi:hypothetical protein
VTVRGDKSKAVLPYVDENRGRESTVLTDRAGRRQDLAKPTGELTAVKSCGRRHRLLLAAKQHLHRRERAPTALEAPFEASPVRVLACAAAGSLVRNGWISEIGISRARKCRSSAASRSCPGA